MSTAENGKTVKVHYTGKLEDGTVFDSSVEREPFQFQLGSGQVIPGFESGIVGMETGQKKTIEITPDEGYGQRRDDLIAQFKKSDFPENITPEVGQNLTLTQPDGKQVNVVVTDIQEETVTLDANHPLAGKKLLFDVELLEVA